VFVSVRLANHVGVVVAAARHGRRVRAGTGALPGATGPHQGRPPSTDGRSLRRAWRISPSGPRRSCTAADSLWSPPTSRSTKSNRRDEHRDFVPRGVRMQDADNTRLVHTTINRRWNHPLVAVWPALPGWCL